MDLQCSTIVGPKIIICWTIAYACLVDLQALLVTASLKGDGPANNSFKRQATSSLTMVQG